MKRAWGLPKEEMLCGPGTHKPAILHRSGGPPAEKYNRCKICGNEIYKLGDQWLLDTGERKSWDKNNV